VAARAAGDGRCAGVPPGRPSCIPGPKRRGRVAGGSGGGRNSPPVPSPPRCGAVPPALPPGWADGDNGDHGTRAVARGNAGNGNPLGNNDAATAAIAGKRTMRDRRTTTAAVTMKTTTRTTTSGGGARSSNRPPPRRHCFSATSSAMPLPRPACCCRASQCPGLTSNTATP
jgi:hypothetical protein